jgi:hypothetical protein
MTCEEAEPLLPLAADGVLDLSDDPALFSHLARCPSCQDQLARHDLVDLALRRGFDARPVRRIIALPVWLRRRPTFTRAALAAAAAVVAVIGAAVWLGWPASAAPGSASAIAQGDAPPRRVDADGPAIFRLPGARSRYLVVQGDGSTLVVDPTAGDTGASTDSAPTATVGY